MQEHPPHVLRNPRREGAVTIPQPSTQPLEFHQRLPDYQRTRLVTLPEVAAELGLRRVWLKDESYRLGLPSFKILGASWAVYRALSAEVGAQPKDWNTLDELRDSFHDAFQPTGPPSLVAATDGNHGRALARVARWFGCSARIFLPRAAPPGRVASIRAEGATIVVVDGSYDDAVEAAANWSDGRSLLIPDTARSTDDVVPRWICEGYSTLFWEIDEQLSELGEGQPDLVLIQIGVGSLAGAAVAHYRREGMCPVPTLVGVEPASSACVLESARAGEFRAVPGPHNSVMDCLNAGKASRTTLPALLDGFDAFLAVGDDRVWACVEELTRAGVVSGTTGAAGLVGLHEFRQVDGSGSSALVINTEGNADPGGYAAAMQVVAGLAAPGHEEPLTPNQAG